MDLQVPKDKVEPWTSVVQSVFTVLETQIKCFVSDSLFFQQQLYIGLHQLLIYNISFHLHLKIFDKGCISVQRSICVCRRASLEWKSLQNKRLCILWNLLLPERTPSNVALAQVLMRSCLFNEQFYLGGYIEGFIMREVSTSELISNPVDDLNCLLI